jgi:hypothetical protein
MDDTEFVRERARLLGISETELRMRMAVPDSLMANIVNDFRRGMPQSTSMLPDQRTAPVKRGSGWVEERPLRPPDGIKLIDAMCEAEAARERQAKINDQMKINNQVKINMQVAEELHALELQQKQRDAELDPTGQLYSNPDDA